MGVTHWERKAGVSQWGAGCLRLVPCEGASQHLASGEVLAGCPFGSRVRWGGTITLGMEILTAGPNLPSLKGSLALHRGVPGVRVWVRGWVPVGRLVAPHVGGGVGWAGPFPLVRPRRSGEAFCLPCFFVAVSGWRFGRWALVPSLGLGVWLGCCRGWWFLGGGCWWCFCRGGWWPFFLGFAPPPPWVGSGLVPAA